MWFKASISPYGQENLIYITMSGSKLKIATISNTIKISLVLSIVMLILIELDKLFRFVMCRVNSIHVRDN